MNLSRTIARLALLPAVGATLLLGAGAASAHVSVTASETAAGAYTVLTFSVPHGCDGSPTKKVAIQLPEEIVAATPTRQPFYDVEKVMENLDAPIKDAHGNEITERVGQIVYTAKTPLPDGQRDTFEVSVQLPDAAGATLDFPTIQTCVKGETAWTEVPADGQDAEELEAPAPNVVITDAESHADSGNASDRESDDGVSRLAIAGLVVGLLGLLAGGTALSRSRKA
ncbi:MULTISPECIES: YcnI family copper-binding membrane protein [unclassified Nocardioides]|uniref:YcnI family copper-binding membrane protein n=1 Tax=unclassified Nocardioides TaxID=2615069 RepID=UPI00070146B2|nr:MULTISPECIES: YcnI family protein [unclassified Nocardioides]KQY51659.1 hypothetical protein ASD30_20045 [Nocardioides sp. Root140]KRF10939.1 hypothetical protein ASH02_19045 [Nocardioides sp. Soil796]